jgi:hypothetical protein
LSLACDMDVRKGDYVITNEMALEMGCRLAKGIYVINKYWVSKYCQQYFELQESSERLVFGASLQVVREVTHLVIKSLISVS